MGVHDRTTASVVVVAIIAAQSWFMGRAVLLLNLVLVLSFAVWATRPRTASPRRVLPAVAAAVVVQLGHLTEEYYTGFQRALPALVGYAWEDWRYLTFNGAWLVAFAASAVAIAHRQRLGYLGAFFLALGGGVGNGLAHLALVARAGGYFPGAYTAPLCLVAGVLLLARLLDDSAERAQAV